MVFLHPLFLPALHNSFSKLLEVCSLLCQDSSSCLTKILTVYYFIIFFPYHFSGDTTAPYVRYACPFLMLLQHNIIKVDVRTPNGRLIKGHSLLTIRFNTPVIFPYEMISMFCYTFKPLATNKPALLSTEYFMLIKHFYRDNIIFKEFQSNLI